MQAACPEKVRRIKAGRSQTRGRPVNGNAIQLWDCSGVEGQQWTMHSDGTIRAFGKCWDVDGAGTSTANSTPIELWTCDGLEPQRWSAPL